MNGFRRFCAFVLVLFATFSAYATLLSLNSSLVTLPAMNPIQSYSFNHVKGEIGEAITKYDYIGRLAKTGWKNVTPRTGAQGLDHLALKFNAEGYIEDVLVVETKFTNKSLKDALGKTKDGRQLSSDWTYERIKKDVVPRYEEFYTNDDSVIKTDILPNVEERLYIDEDSFYFYDEDGNKCFYSSNQDMLSDSAKRISRAETTVSDLQRFAKQTTLKRRVVQFSRDSEGNLSRAVYEISDGEDSKSIKIEDPEVTEITSENLSTALNSSDYKNSLKRMYNLEDASVLDNLSDTQLLRLSNGLDADTAEVILSSKQNSAQLAKKLGLNVDTDFSDLDLTDNQWKKISSASSLEDLGDITVEQKLKSRSKLAAAGSFILTVRESGRRAGIGFITGSVINILQQGLTNGFNNINYLDVARVGLFSSTMVVVNNIAEGLAKGLFTTTVKDAAKLSKILSVTPFMIDALFDVGFVAYRYFTGTYDYTSQAIAEGAINIGFDVATYLLCAKLGSMGAFAGPGGIVAGVVIAAAFSFGSQYLIKPISNALALRGLWKDLDKDYFANVTKWTAEYVSE